MRISRDALFNIHATARDSSNKFIHAIHTFPNLFVICGHSLMLDEVEKVDLLYFDTTEQCLSYDTTFQLGDFYVSALFPEKCSCSLKSCFCRQMPLWYWYTLQQD